MSIKLLYLLQLTANQTATNFNVGLIVQHPLDFRDVLAGFLKGFLIF